MPGHFHPCDGCCALSSVLVKTHPRRIATELQLPLRVRHKDITAPISLAKDFNSCKFVKLVVSFWILD